jgi:endonuclease-3
MITLRNIGRVLQLIGRWAKNQSVPSVSQISQEHPSPYKVLISTILSLRTKDQVTVEASRRLFAAAETPRQMLHLTESRITRLIYPVGFYKTKSRTILHISKELIDRYQGFVPDELEKLLEFKGVGRKTANLVLILGFQKPAMCVDTHVHRISNRWGFIKTRNPDESEMALRKILPVKYWLDYNDLLVTFGQQLCKPVSPYCSKCSILNLCPKNGVTTKR